MKQSKSGIFQNSGYRTFLYSPNINDKIGEFIQNLNWADTEYLNICSNYENYIFCGKEGGGKKVEHDVDVQVQENFLSIRLIIIYVSSCSAFFPMLYLVNLCK